MTRAVAGYLAQEAGLLRPDPGVAQLRTGGILNSASFIAGSVAPEELVTLLGSGFDDAPSVLLRDSAGREQPATLVYGSPGQLNVVLPSGAAPGPATVSVACGDGAQARAALDIGDVAPGVFTVGSNGLGAPAAHILRVAMPLTGRVFDIREVGKITGLSSWQLRYFDRLKLLPGAVLRQGSRRCYIGQEALTLAVAAELMTRCRLRPADLVRWFPAIRQHCQALPPTTAGASIFLIIEAPDVARIERTESLIRLRDAACSGSVVLDVERALAKVLSGGSFIGRGLTNRLSRLH